MDVDQHIAGPRLWLVDLGEAENFRASERGDLYGSHTPTLPLLGPPMAAPGSWGPPAASTERARSASVTALDARRTLRRRTDGCPQRAGDRREPGDRPGHRPGPGQGR